MALAERAPLFEPTGPRAVERALGVAGVPFVKVNPRQARRFAEATGKLAKTDRLDAAILARIHRHARMPLCRLLDRGGVRSFGPIGLMRGERSRNSDLGFRRTKPQVHKPSSISSRSRSPPAVLRKGQNSLPIGLK